MLQLLAGTDAGESEGSVRFKRHRPEQTLLYRLIEQYYPDFEMQWASEGRVLHFEIGQSDVRSTPNDSGNMIPRAEQVL